MIRTQRLVFALAAAVAFVSASTMVIHRVCADVPIGPATTPSATQPAASQPAPAFAAMDYYDQSCARCHGPQGSFYGPSLGRDLDDKGLIKVCSDMAQGPAQAALEDSDNLVETAFHRALIMRTPYLSVTKIEGTKWSGEVMPDSKVTITVGDKQIKPAIDSWNWTAELPPNTRRADVVIEAQLNGKKTVLKPAESTYSNTAPIPPKDQRPTK